MCFFSGSFNRIAVLLLVVLPSLPASASVVISGTRLVFPAAQSEITVRLSNDGAVPALVQAWTDDGDANSSPDTAQTPFVLSPPILRIDPGKGHSIRMMFAGDALPADRESVFWLNVLEIPPKAENAAQANLLQMAFRSRIKIFYRPKNLPGNATEAMQQLRWSVVPGKDGASVLSAHNSSAYHVSLFALVLVSGAQRSEANEAMIAPGETRQFALTAFKSAPATDAYVEFKAIDDWGAQVSVKKAIGR